MSARLASIVVRSKHRAHDFAFAAFVVLVAFMAVSAIHLAGLASR
jgi:hypothetical protein